MERSEVLDELRTRDVDAFVSEHIFDRVPHAFADNRTKFIAWKRQLADGLGVDPADITIVGSAAVGISLNPYKKFRAFSSKSDIDVAIVSPFHFQTAWRFLRHSNSLRYKLSERERAAWDEHRTNLLFWGTIATDRLLSLLPFGREWIEALSKQQDCCDLTNEVKVRVYNDYDSLRTYTRRSVKSSQKKALES